MNTITTPNAADRARLIALREKAVLEGAESLTADDFAFLRSMTAIAREKSGGALPKRAEKIARRYGL